jgi:GT2 family glycosyltransferase
VHYGSYADLQACLRSLQAHSRGLLETIVVDNNRLPDDFNMLFPDVRLVRAGRNLGFGPASNLGAKHATGPILIFMNNDVEVTRAWLEPLLAILSDTSIGCVCPLILFKGNSGSGNMVNAAGGACDPFGLAWNRGLGRPRTATISEPLFYAPGCLFAVRRDAFEKIGGFDESFFLFLEDVDLSWRLKLGGWNLSFSSESIALHKWMASTSRLSSSDIQYLYNRNRLRIILKNYGASSLFRILPIYLTLQLGLLGWVLARKRGSELRAILAAWLWNFRNLAGTIRARQDTQRSRVRGDREIMEPMYHGIAGIHLALRTMRHPVLETHFGGNRGK